MPQYGRFKIREAGRSFFYVAARQQTSWLLFLYLVAAIATASAQTGSSVPSAETIIASMAQARAENRARLRPYVVTREYKLYGKDGSMPTPTCFVAPRGSRRRLPLGGCGT